MRGVDDRDRSGRRHGAVVRRCRWGLALLLSAAAPLALTGPAAAEPPATPVGAYVANGPVYDIARSAGRTFIGGDFTRVGRRFGAGVTLSFTGSRLAFPEVAGGEVRAAVSDGDGGWYIGGTFTHVGGQPHVALAHIEGDGSVDGNFIPVATLDGAPAQVNALAYSTTGPDAGWLYVGGRFDKIGRGGGEPRENLAALNGLDGRAHRDFGPVTRCPNVPSCSPAVRALALAQPTLQVENAPAPVPLLFVGGDFRQLGPSDGPPAIPGLGAVWGVGSREAVGSPNAGALLQNETGSTIWKVSDPGPSSVKALALPADLTASDVSFPIYVGGDLGTSFDAYSRLAAFQVRIDPATHAPAQLSRFSEWKPWANGTVRGVAATAGTIYFGGDFTTVGSPGVGPPHLASMGSIPRGVNNAWWNASSPAGPPTMGQPFGGGLPTPARAVASNGSTVFVGGRFDEGVRAFTTSGVTAPGWVAPVPDGPVATLATAGGALYAGGEFRALESRPRTGLAAFDSQGMLLDTWAPQLTSSTVDPPQVRALAASDSTVFVGGQFDSVAGATRKNLAAVDATSGALHGFQPAVTRAGGSPQVKALALVGSSLYVGGAFDHVGGASRGNLATVDAGSGSVSGWDPQANDIVYDVLPACGEVFVGGAFTKVGGQDRGRIAALDAGAGKATGWRADATGAVLALARSGSTIYAGGSFAHIGGLDREKLAGLNIRDARLTGLNPLSDGPVSAVAAQGGAVYAGGQFSSIGGQDRRNLAALDPGTGAALGWNPQPNAIVRALVLSGDAIYAGGDFQAVGATAQSAMATFGPGAGEPQPEACIGTLTTLDGQLGAAGSAVGGETVPRAATPGGTAPFARLSRVAVLPARLRVGRRALVLRFTLSRPARVRVLVQRRSFVRCKARPGRPTRRRCAVYRRFASLTVTGKRGVNRVTFRRQRIAGRRLSAGRYRALLSVLPVGGGTRNAPAYFRMTRRR